MNRLMTVPPLREKQIPSPHKVKDAYQQLDLSAYWSSMIIKIFGNCNMVFFIDISAFEQNPVTAAEIHF